MNLIKNSKQKHIYKYSLVIFIITLFLSIILGIIFPKVHLLPIGEIVGYLASVGLFVLLEIKILDTHYLDLLKVTKWYHRIYQLCLLAVLAIFAIVFKDPFIILGVVVGLLMINLSIVIYSFMNKTSKGV